MKKTLTKILKKILPYSLKNELKAIKANKAFTDFDKIEEVCEKKFIKKVGFKPNWEHPESFNEKIIVSKIYGATPEKTRDTDKVAVRETVEKLAGEQYLIPLVGVYDRLADADFDSLPKQFVIKCNHDSHSVKIVKDKSALTKKEWKRIVSDFDHYYLKRKYQRHLYEPHYADIRPKVVIERFMGENINDYKFLCFSGKPFCCWVDTDRFVGHMRNYYDLDWNHMELHSSSYPQNPELTKRPERLDEMIELATKLSSGYDQVRVDLYEIEGKVYFGELTFTSDAGQAHLVPDEWEKIVGDLWEFDDSRRGEIRKNHKDIREICKNW